jgi:two-component system, cell cycle sensor histidine kinase and response regulator CckA
MNLGSNAGHAMRRAGGVLRVTLKEIVIGPECPDQDLPLGRYVELSVADTGHGMEKEVLDRVFDPFFTTKKLGEGTGLGLSVVHGIVKNHRGAIRVFSKPGRGTAFHVLLPRLERQAGGDPEPLRRVSNGKANLLFVDDEASIVQLYRQMLEGLGYKVTAHTDSRAALEAFRAQPGGFDLVITDLTMPGLTGIDLFREITAIRPDTPVILCTGFHDAVRPEEMFRAFLTKPILMHELSETVQEVLRPSPPR